MITDLTEGTIHKKLWLFSIPMLVSVMFQQIYNIADSMIAGKFVGEDALAAIGASYIAQGISCVFSIITLTIRLKKFHLRKEQIHVLFSFDMLRKISVTAIPSILQQSFISVGNIFIQSIINGFGSAIVAGYSAAIKLNTFAITSFTTLANGLSSFTAQNIGAKKLDRIKKGFWSGIVLAICIVIPFFLAFFFFARPLMQAFRPDTSESTLAMNTGIEFLQIVAPFYFVISIKLMSDGVLRGSGAMTYFMTATFSDLILRVVLAYLLSNIYEITGVWLSWPLGWIIGTALSFGFYLKGVWKKKMI